MNKEITVRLDAVTQLGKIYLIEMTSAHDGGIRSILARVAGPCIAEEHGDAEHIANVIARALSDALPIDKD
jgi:hypothetical protein